MKYKVLICIWASVNAKVYLTMVRILSKLESGYLRSLRSQSIIFSEILFYFLMFSLKIKHILNSCKQ